MGFKKLLLGEPMPDKNDPKYKERYEREVEAGRKFADISGISWLAMQIQRLANSHRKGFLVVVFGIVILCFGYNVTCLILHYYAGKTQRKVTAVERVDSALVDSHSFK